MAESNPPDSTENCGKADGMDTVRKILDSLPVPEKYLLKSPKSRRKSSSESSLDSVDNDQGSPTRGSPTGGCDTRDGAQAVNKHMPKIYPRKGSQAHNVGMTRSSSGYNVPTAHVSPSLAAHPAADSSSVSQRAGLISTLPARYDRELYTKQEPTSQRMHKTWGSQPNLLQKATYEGLTEDPDLTLDQSRFVPHSDLMHTAGSAYDNAYQAARDVALPHKRGAMILKESQDYLRQKEPQSQASGFSSSAYHSDLNGDNFNVLTGLPSHSRGGYSSANDYDFIKPRQQYQWPMDNFDSSHATNAAQGFDAHLKGGLDHMTSKQSTDSFDLTRWQQLHQDDLRRQKYEASQLLQMPYTTMPTSSSSSRLMPPDDKLGSVKQAADNIIKEKDQIIDRQKMKILHLETGTRELESGETAHRSLVSQAQQDTAVLREELMKLQYENAALKAKMCDIPSSGGAGNLEKKLGQTEYELEELRSVLEKTMASGTSKVEDLKQQIQKQDKEIEEWKEKHEKSESKCQQLQQRVNSMEQYFKDVATPDENKQKEKELVVAQEVIAKLKKQLSDAAKRLAEMEKGIKSRDALIESLESDQQEQSKELQESKEVKTSLEKDIQRLKDIISDKYYGEDIDEMKEENKRLRTEFARAKKLLETFYKQQKDLETGHRVSMQQLKERLEQEETAVAGLREEIATKDQHLRKLRQSVKELGKQNQDMMEKNVSLGEQLKQYEQEHKGDIGKLQRRLVRELSICFAELQGIVQICVQRAEGDTPNLSMLLGTKSAAVDLEPPDQSLTGVSALKYKVTKVGEMRKDIDNLRELISTKYAEDMGENLNCTTQ